MSPRTPDTLRIPTTTLYCRSRSAKGEVITGVEILEWMRKSTASQKAAGRVGLRFFDTLRPKAEHVFVTLEPWEAFDLATKIEKLIGTPTPQTLELAPHKFISAHTHQETLTIVGVEKWVRGPKSGYAIKVVRKGGLNYNVALPEAQIRYASLFLRHLAIAQSWEDRPLAALRAPSTASSTASTPGGPLCPAPSGPSPASARPGAPAPRRSSALPPSTGVGSSTPRA